MSSPSSSSEDSSWESRYRSMTQAASALFSAESTDEFESQAKRWASTLFPSAECRFWSHGSRQPASFASAEATSDRGVIWGDPADMFLPPSVNEASSSPEAVALLPLSAETASSRSLLLMYRDEVPEGPECEAVDTFGELVYDASEACLEPAVPAPSETDRTQSLIEVANTIASQLELSEAIQVVAEQTSQLLNADRSSVWLYDEPNEEIYTIVAQELGNEEIRMPADQGLAGHVLQSGEPLNLNDAYDHPDFDPSHDEATGYRTRSMLCTPLRNRQGEKLGVFQVINKEDGRFTEEDHALLETVAGSAAVAIENALLYNEQQRQFESFIQVLATTIDSRDPTTGQHTVMVTGIAVLIAEEMDLPPDTVEKIRVAAILHDVGKIVLPDEVLLKQGELTDTEYEIVQSHVSHTIQILDCIHFHRDLDDVPRIAGAHHERLDGEGYPRGLSAEDLSLPMRILAVADVFHALIQDRPYKDSFSISEAIEECRRISGSAPNPPTDEDAHLDPQAVEALVQHLEREGTDDFQERVVERSGFEEKNVFAPDLNLPD